MNVPVCRAECEAGERMDVRANRPCVGGLRPEASITAGDDDRRAPACRRIRFTGRQPWREGQENRSSVRRTLFRVSEAWRVKRRAPIPAEADPVERLVRRAQLRIERATEVR